MMKKTKNQISYNMSQIRGKDTVIEILLRKALWSKGFRYRKNYKKLPGTPDIVFLKHKVAIFCDSDFWHGYNWENQRNNLRSNFDFWDNKIKTNMKRDIEVDEKLRILNWTVLRFWEHEIKEDINKCVKIILRELKND